MSVDPKPGLTILRRCGLPPVRLVGDQAKPGSGRACPAGSRAGRGSGWGHYSQRLNKERSPNQSDWASEVTVPFSQFSITQPASPGYLQRSLNGSGLIAEYLTVFVIWHGPGNAEASAYPSPCSPGRSRRNGGACAHEPGRAALRLRPLVQSAGRCPYGRTVGLVH